MDDLSPELDKLRSILNLSEEPDKLKLSVLSHITENFSDKHKIGEGGSGRVYKGNLPSGQIIAVKKLFNSHMDEKFFEQELTTMMMVKHRNIVQFIGYCCHTEERRLEMEGKYIFADERERLLCFEYISNGNLERYLTDELRGLEWDTRFQIIRGICEGLRYLHQEKGIIHMDLKPSNILLTHDLVPKIADFGISRLGETTKTTCLGRHFSLGYCPPEYLFNGKMSFKLDIYSLGIIIIELVAGTRNDNPDITIVCRRWRHRWNKSGKHSKLLGWQQQVTRCLELARRCNNSNPKERPDIQDIISELSEMESTRMDISNSNISTAEQEKIFLEDMLGIEPLELHLTVELNKPISHSIQLTNDTNDYVAFRIEPLEEKGMALVSATRRISFCMHPSKGVIPRRSSCIVTITLETLKKLLEESYVAKLLVQSVKVDEGLTTVDITGDVFKEEPGKVVDAVEVSVDVQKWLLVVEPPELRYWPMEPNKLLPCSLQLTNTTDEYVAFTFILPQGKVLYNEAMGMGIMPPCSTRRVIMDMVVEEAPVEMQWKDTCLVRSVVVDKGLRVDDLSVDFFSKQMGVHQMKLDIVFAEQPHAPSPGHHHPIFDGEQDLEDDEPELMGDGVALISPLSMETELLHIYPAELCFTTGGKEYISLINKTDDEIIYVIVDDINGNYTTAHGDYKGVVLPHSTRAVLVTFEKKPNKIGVVMVSGSHFYRTADDIAGDYNLKDIREKLINQVRSEGGKAHEALLACVVRAPCSDNKQKKSVVLRMDENGLQSLECMDVHPRKPWVVTCHADESVCIWKVDLKTGVCATISTSNTHPILSVKFIARMQWVTCGGYNGYITVYTYADNTLTKIKKFKAEEGPVRALAVHPKLPYLLSSTKCNLIKLWDWDQGWICTRTFSCFSARISGTCEMAFNPKDVSAFASLSYGGEIKIWRLDSVEQIASLPGDTIGLAYCNTGSGQCMAALNWRKRRIEFFDIRSNTTTHVHTLEVEEFLSVWSRIANHPTRPILAAAESGNNVLLWNYTTDGLKKVSVSDYERSNTKGIGFIDVEGFQRLVIADSVKIMLVDIVI